MEQINGSELLMVYRVPYGKDDTPEELREYKLRQGGPVGNMSEWEAFAKSNKLKGLRLVELDGSVGFLLL